MWGGLFGVWVVGVGIGGDVGVGLGVVGVGWYACR